MHAVAAPAPSQALRVINTFDPRPLEAVMAARGFDFEVREVGPQHWEVLFTPQTSSAAGLPRLLDNRGLQAAEAGARTPQALRRVPAARGPTAIFDHEPASLCAELERHGYRCTWTRDATRAWRASIRRAA